MKPDLHSDVDTNTHGGPDSGPPIRIDFSTNAHPLGPTPAVLSAVLQADRSRYPDPQYRALVEALAALHRVAPQRVVVGGSASELIWRLTAVWAREVRGARADLRPVVIADPASFGEYRRAALACGLPVVGEAQREAQPGATLSWHCSPQNPGGALARSPAGGGLGWGQHAAESLTVLDLAYRPFQHLLEGAVHPLRLDAPPAHTAVQLWSPNKLHGLTGVRAAYLVLPLAPHPLITADTLNAAAPAWLLGADGVALLHAHGLPESLAFLRAVQPALQARTAAHRAALAEAGWQLEPAALHFGLAKPPVVLFQQPAWHAALRAQGIKLRDAASFGLPGRVRLRCGSAAEVQALLAVTSDWSSR